MATMMTLRVTDEEEFVDPFHISIQLLTQRTHFEASAFINSGATCNTLSYDVWEALGKPKLINAPLSF